MQLAGDDRNICLRPSLARYFLLFQKLDGGIYVLIEAAAQHPKKQTHDKLQQLRYHERRGCTSFIKMEEGILHTSFLVDAAFSCSLFQVCVMTLQCRAMTLHVSPQHGPEAMKLKVEESYPKHFVSLPLGSKHAGHTGSKSRHADQN